MGYANYRIRSKATNQVIPLITTLTNKNILTTKQANKTAQN